MKYQKTDRVEDRKTQRLIKRYIFVLKYVGI